MSTASATVDQVQMLPVERISRSPHNPRKVSPQDPATKELAKSIRQVGLIQPPTVRPLGDDYELVAGERRWCASKLAGLKEIPCFVRELTDREAMEICVTENLQREDLHPLEEAAGVATLLEEYSGDRQAVAAQLGRGLQWVSRRARLTTLVDELRKMSVGRADWSAGHLEVLALLEPNAQRALAKDAKQRGWHFLNRPQTVSELESEVADYLQDVDRAPWKTDDEDLVDHAPACTRCTRRSTAPPGLFEEVEESGKLGRCLDSTCWDSKQEAFLDQREAKLREKHGDQLLLIRQHGAPEREGAILDYSVQPSKKGAKGSRPALDLASGRVKWVKPYTSRNGASRKKKDGKPTTLAERRKALDRRRLLLAIDRIRAEAETVPVPRLRTLAALAAVFGTNDRLNYLPWGEKADAAWKRFRSADGVGGMQVRSLLWTAILPVMRKRLEYLGAQQQVAEVLWPEAKRLAELLGIDAQALHTQALKELPEPKSWAKLNADGTPKTKKKPASRKNRKAKAKKGAKR